MSQSAAGVVGDVLQYQSWKGRSVAGRRRRPAQPRTQSQRATRVYMTWLSQQWKIILPEDKTTWEAAPIISTLPLYNRFLKINLDRFKNLPANKFWPDDFDVFPTQVYPANRVLFGATTNTHLFTGGSRKITHTFNVTSVQDLWAFFYHCITPGIGQAIYGNLVAIKNVRTTGAHTVIIEPLDPGVTTIRYSRVHRDGNTDHFYRDATRLVTE